MSDGAAENPFGDEAVYELEAGVAGREMTPVAAAPFGNDLPFYWETVRREENRYYQAALVDAPDRWLWDVLLAPAAKTYSLDVSELAVGTATLRIRLQGASDVPGATDHHVRLFVNDHFVTEATWSGKTSRNIDVSVSSSMLHDGLNEIEIENVGDTDAPYSMVMLDWFELRYARRPVLQDSELEGSWPEAGTTEVQTPTDVVAIVAESDSIVSWIDGLERTENAVRFSVEPDHRYRVFTAPLSPEIELVRRQPKLRTSRRRAEWLVIGPRAFVDAAKPLIAHRRAQGMKAVAIATEDFFESFGHGETNPEAIHAFLRHVYHE